MRRESAKSFQCLWPGWIWSRISGSNRSRSRSFGEQVEQSGANFLKLQFESNFSRTYGGFDAAFPSGESGIVVNVGRGNAIHLACEVMLPIAGFARVHMQANFGLGIEFLERDADDAGKKGRVELGFTMHDLTGDGKGQFDDFALNAAVVALPFRGELLKRMVDLFAALGNRNVEFRTQLLLPAQASLFESLGLCTSDLFLDLARV